MIQEILDDLLIDNGIVNEKKWTKRKPNENLIFFEESGD